MMCQKYEMYFDMHNLFSIQLPSSRLWHACEYNKQHVYNIIYEMPTSWCYVSKIGWWLCCIYAMYKFQFPCRHDANIYNEWPHATPILWWCTFCINSAILSNAGSFIYICRAPLDIYRFSNIEHINLMAIQYIHKMPLRQS